MTATGQSCGTCRFLDVGTARSSTHPLPMWTYRCKAETARGREPDSVLLGARYGPHIRKTMTGQEGTECRAWEERER